MLIARAVIKRSSFPEASRDLRRRIGREKEETSSRTVHIIREGCAQSRIGENLWIDASCARPRGRMSRSGWHVFLRRVGCSGGCFFYRFMEMNVFFIVTQCLCIYGKFLLQITATILCPIFNLKFVFGDIRYTF